MIKFTINLPPVTKKNSPQIVTRGNRYILLPSKPYLNYERDAKWFMPHTKAEGAVNVKALFYMPTRRRVDLVNLLQALLDILVKYGVLEDDNSKIVVSMDGSRVLYDKDNPRTEVEITKEEVADDRKNNKS